MVIHGSAMSMSTQSFYSNYWQKSVGYTGWGDRVKDERKTASTTPLAMDGLQKKGTSDVQTTTQATGNVTDFQSGLVKDLQSGIITDLQTGTMIDPNAGVGEVNSYNVGIKEKMLSASNDSFQNDDIKTEAASLGNLFSIFSNKNLVAPRKITPYELFEQLMSNFRERLSNILNTLRRGNDNYRAGNGMSGFGRGSLLSDSVNSVYSVEMYTESEEMTYTTDGVVRTADGREIKINVSAVMSRSFTEYSEVKINYNNYKLIDPLVINLTGGAAELSDRKFYFDIDADGEEDNISLLAKGCGFLALDRNGDGVINDGSELFGTETGDGFSELAVFDLDGNGWIDENDEIFNHLRIWTKDSEGKTDLWLWE